MANGFSRASMRSHVGNTDRRALEVALLISSILVWVPYSIAAIYTAHCNSFFIETGDRSPLSSGSDSLPFRTIAPKHTFETSISGNMALVFQRISFGDIFNYFKYYVFPKGFDVEAFLPVVLQILAFSLFGIVTTWILSVRIQNGGEFLFVLSWLLGVFSERFWLTSNTPAFACSSETHTLSSIPTVTMSSHVPVGLSSDMAMHNYHCLRDPGWMWLVVSVTTGFFSGILCKAKDVLDTKVSRGDHIHRIFEYPVNNSVASRHKDDGNSNESQLLFQRRKKHVIGLGERLYMLLPFFTGQWFWFILKNGWRGIFVQTGITVLTLGMVGYCMVSFKLLKHQLLLRGIIKRRRRTHKMVRHTYKVIDKRNPTPHDDPMSDGLGKKSVFVAEEEYIDASLDIVEFISRLFTSSFGVVMLILVSVNVFVTSLAIPFLKALSSFNALVNSLGIVVELIIYEIA